ncbi:nucleotidyltransferase domain-containing protein [Geitlerinema splendidum]|nr:nucleotidyltransferase domain-containing protein [Geitlerinema splendidum]
MDYLEIEQRTILIALTGSYGYGLAMPGISDRDYRGVFIATQPYYLGFSKIEQRDRGWDTSARLFPYLSVDTSIYELKKFLELCTDNNPNILELLWFNQYEHLTDIGKTLVEHKQMFLSTKVKHTYAGYGYAQLKKLESHRRWLLNPPQVKPTPADYGLTEIQPLTKDEVNAFLEYLYLLVRDKVQFLEPAQQLYQLLTAEIDYKGIFKQYPLSDEALEYTQKLTQASDKFIQRLQKTQQYQAALREYNAYQSWKKNRNPARAALEAKVGYDAKFAMQAIRLLRTGLEILEHGELIVDRRIAGDAEELLAMKRGEYRYEEMMAIANSLYQRLETAYPNSTLPRTVDRDAVNQLCIDLVTRQGW